MRDARGVATGSASLLTVNEHRMLYDIQQRIHTLSHNAVMGITEPPPRFSVQGVDFFPWEFSSREGWGGNYWIAQAKVESSNLREALKEFQTKLISIVPKIAFIGQSYIEFNRQSVFVLRSDQHIGWLRYTNDTEACPLMFGPEQLEALKLLLGNGDVPDQFYFYWNEAMNTFGYSGKLLLMFSALEALFPKVNKNPTKLTTMGR